MCVREVPILEDLVPDTSVETPASGLPLVYFQVAVSQNSK